MSRLFTLDREGQRHIFVLKKKGEVVVRAMSDNSPLSDQVVASTLPLNIGDQLRYPQVIVEQVRDLTKLYGDDRVAADKFNQQGIISATGKPFTEEMIQWIRFKHDIPLSLAKLEHELTVSEVAQRFSISTHMVYYYVTANVLTSRKTRKCILIRVNPNDETTFQKALDNAPKAAHRTSKKEPDLCLT